MDEGMVEVMDSHHRCRCERVWIWMWRWMSEECVVVIFDPLSLSIETEERSMVIV